MKSLSLKLKIIVIFFIPLTALVYFSFSFVQIKYQNLNESSMNKLSAITTDKFSKLIHNLQIERGLSSGYIASPDISLNKVKLLNHYKLTDIAYKEFLNFINLKSNEKKLLQQTIGDKNKPIIKQIIIQLNDLDNIRKRVLNSSINFDEEIQYYNRLNSKLLESMRFFIIILNKQSNENNALYKLQLLKENAGIERAYIYNQLVLNSFKYTKKIKTLQKEQQYNQEQFKLNASVDSKLIYTSVLNKKNKEQLDILRENFLNNSLDNTSAANWFKITTARIDMLESISSKILDQYIKTAKNIHSQAISYLYFTAILWILSLLSLTILAFILKNLLENEKQHIEELRISAYTFDSHEAITITDANGVIIKVNNGFTRITGYEPYEVIGKNPNVLKSMKHDDEFYKEMWHKLNTKGRWSNEIYNKRKNGEIYLERLYITAIKDKNNVTTHYIAQFQDISDVKKAQLEAQYQADHDFLTGLINRRFLIQRLNEEFAKAKRHNFSHAFLFIDLDKFKAINDSYGHKIGDKLLIKISHRLRSILREEDIISRMSGDEFAIIILNIDKTDKEAAKDVKKVCKKILNELNNPFIVNEYKLNISASIGVRLFPDAEKKTQDIIIHADAAMYQAKKQGKNQFVFFDKAIELELKQFQLLEDELNLAYNNNEFKFFYQPKVDTATGKVVGAEALLRWQHPEKGLLYPDSFLKVASKIGMIPKITILALHDACKFIKSNNHIFNGVISINIDSNELLDPTFEQDVISTVKSHNIDPTKIELEITENDLIKDFQTAISMIKRLKKFGFKFSIDDFGTGYSSITYLQNLPVDSLKIDRSFLHNLSDKSNQELVKIIINMAKTFNMCSIVEGIEDETQLQFIKDNGADQYQGYYFSKAVDKESFIALL